MLWAIVYLYIPAPLPSPPPSVILDYEIPPSQETLKRLASHNKRIPLPSHSKSCDAR